jgi:hypothetical protein
MNEQTWIIGALSWFLPGAGHIRTGHWKRGLIIGLIIWGMFFVGIFGGGAFYPGHSFKDGMLLYLLNIFSRLGNGLGFLVSLIFGSGQANGVAASALFEYSGRFVEVAGLLNYLAIIDAIDLGLKRKE